MFTISPIARIATASLALGAFGVAHADPAANATDGLWHGAISLGGAATSGNTTTTVLTGNVDATRATTADKINLYGLVNYGRSRSDATGRVTTADLARLGGRYDWNLTNSVFAFGGAQVETNKVNGEKSRYDLNAGVGYKVIDTPNNTFNVFGGLGYSGSKLTDGTSPHGGTLIIGEESNSKLSESTSFKQKLVFIPGQNDLGRQATFNAGLATAISGGWTLNTGLSVNYNSAPPLGFKKTDTLLSVGFGYKI